MAKRPVGDHEGDAADKTSPTSDRQNDNLKKDRTADSTVVDQERRKVADEFSMDSHKTINSFAIVDSGNTVAKAWKKSGSTDEAPEQKNGDANSQVEKTDESKPIGEKNRNEKIPSNKRESFDTGTIDVKAVNDAQMAFYKQALDGVTDPVLREGLKLQATIMDHARHAESEVAEPQVMIERSTQGEQSFGSAAAPSLTKFAEKTAPKNEDMGNQSIWRNPPDGQPIKTNEDKVGRIDGVWNKACEYHFVYDGDLSTNVSKVTIKDSTGSHEYAKKPDGWHIDGSAKPSDIKNISVTNIKTGHFEIDYKNGARKYYAPDGRIAENSPPHETTTWPDGRVQYSENSGTKFVRIPDKLGGYTETHAGPRADDSFIITKKADGHLEVKERSEGKPYKKIDDPQVDAERKKLSDLIDKKITNPEEKARFIANMARFEEREHSMEETFRKQGQNPKEAQANAHKEIAKTYSEISRILQDKIEPGVPVDDAKRTLIAEQVMRNAATPTVIDQGGFNTCNVAAIEMRTYARHPAAAAKLVADMATDGKFVLKSGEEVTINKEAYQDFNDPPSNPPNDKSRSLASQIFEVTAVNIHYVTEFGRHMHYEQHKPKPNAEPADSGEVLRDDYRPWFKENHPAIGPTKEANISKQISGDQPKEAIIVWDKESHNAYDTIHDEQTFRDKLIYAKAHGLMPITIQVDSSNEPFVTDSGSGTAGGSGAWHVVNVTDYSDGPPHMVQVDNQWGKDVDRTGKNKMTLDDLYFSMRASNDKDQIKELEDRRAKGTLNPRQEVELDRHKFVQGGLSHDDYAKQIRHHLETAAKNFDNGSMSKDDYNIFLRQFQSNINDLKPTERFKTLEFTMNYVHGSNFENFMDKTMERIQSDHERAVKNKTITLAEINEFKTIVKSFQELRKKFHDSEIKTKSQNNTGKTPANR